MTVCMPVHSTGISLSLSLCISLTESHCVHHLLLESQTFESCQIIIWWWQRAGDWVTQIITLFMYNPKECQQSVEFARSVNNVQNNLSLFCGIWLIYSQVWVWSKCITTWNNIKTLGPFSENDAVVKVVCLCCVNGFWRWRHTRRQTFTAAVIRGDTLRGEQPHRGTSFFFFHSNFCTFK